MGERTVKLTARVFRNEGQFICEIIETKWVTTDPTLDGLLREIPEMVRNYFEGYKQVGNLSAPLLEIGITDIPSSLDVDIDLDLSELIKELHATQHVNIPLAA